jgi:hypothetical protein
VVTPRDAVARRYLAHLGDADLQWLAAAAGVPLRPTELRTEPVRVLDLLDRPEVRRALLTPGRDDADRLAFVSPFLVLAVAVHAAAVEVAETGRVPEWVGLRQRLPLLVGPEARAFVAAPAHRLFLAELLASFATVASGSYLTRTARGWRRRRWSELDPVRLAGLLEAVPESQRPAIYSRLGDVSLFLTGVFPDHVARHAFGPVDAERLLRVARLRSEGVPSTAPVALLEHLGRLWYRRATEAGSPTAGSDVVAAVADGYADARRLLTLVADRYLFPAVESWFPGAA